MKLLEAFENYLIISKELYESTLKYSDFFSKLSVRKLREKKFQEKVSEEEQLKIDIEKEGLEKNIQNLYEEFFEHTKYLIDLLNQCTKINTDEIFEINQNHIETMQNYINVIYFFDNLKKKYTKYDFDMVVDFSKMERQKLQLNIAIKKFNQNFFKDENLALLTVKECEREAGENLHNFLYNFYKKIEG